MSQRCIKCGKGRKLKKFLCKLCRKVSALYSKLGEDGLETGILDDKNYVAVLNQLNKNHEKYGNTEKNNSSL